MPYSKIDELPQDIQSRLPEHAQQIFVAAFNASQSNGMSEDGALEVAWNSVNNEYEPDREGNWHRKPEDPAIHHKAVMSGGN
ncbi:ChaB family protein [Anabaena cylindrica FACHB-243]|uniref:ChaB family protein n=1 Tax=Anabaena cylindrica (strain ATCC 27899 / PCC 7122) TaxID=272123 RepID=K9ZFY1_ANACC|nr:MULTISPECIES: ChaB family protein [Anabaena]AFZ57497.1 ChaB family protein [Anabaena cylindrica PCC 7122]MBD2421181.1 ChaB family protein [Anabaena cylindrica FACHB-243]MBY5281721.1 cation transport regulator ChaB [Anabaena sp. CCAP 1446/1C]MBY5310324.1 cation transport regulator ChaB [Anabaena sp. CCAP 1446/1C]MCM2405939.1 ChaB family protein [Anabaena sp. CCAP 1446/1C]